MDCGGTTQDEELLKKGKLEMQRTFSNVEDRAHEEILRSERHCQRRISSTEGGGNAQEEVRKSSTAENPPWGEIQHKNLNLERMTIDQYTGVIVDNLEKIVVFGKVRYILLRLKNIPFTKMLKWSNELQRGRNPAWLRARSLQPDLRERGSQKGNTQRVKILLHNWWYFHNK